MVAPAPLPVRSEVAPPGTDGVAVPVEAARRAKRTPRVTLLLQTRHRKALRDVAQS